MLNDFVNRVESKFQRDINKIPNPWVISRGLEDKVTKDNNYKDFYGYTSVFKLSEEDKEKCLDIQSKILRQDGGMLIPLPPKTFHLTAHEYANVYSVGNSKDRIEEENDKVIAGIRKLFHSLNRELGDEKITLRALGPSTSGSDVVSIKFAPVLENDAKLLLYIFDKSEEIWPVGREYNPHVSMGYFKLCNFEKSSVEELYKNVKEISKNMDFTISFSVKDLVFQRHFSMEDFHVLFAVGDM